MCIHWCGNFSGYWSEVFGILYVYQLNTEIRNTLGLWYLVWMLLSGHVPSNRRDAFTVMELSGDNWYNWGRHLMWVDYGCVVIECRHKRFFFFLFSSSIRKESYYHDFSIHQGRGWGIWIWTPSPLDGKRMRCVFFGLSHIHRQNSTPLTCMYVILH